MPIKQTYIAKPTTCTWSYACDIDRWSTTCGQSGNLYPLDRAPTNADICFYCCKPYQGNDPHDIAAYNANKPSS